MYGCTRSSSVDPGSWGIGEVLTPKMFCRRVRVFDPRKCHILSFETVVGPLKIWRRCQEEYVSIPAPINVTVFHSELLFDNSASITSSRMKGFCKKNGR